LKRLPKLAAALVTAGLVAVTIEVFAFAALSAMNGQLTSWSSVRAAQDEARATAGDVDPAMEMKDVPLPAYISQGVVHPYVGYVLSREFKPTTRRNQGGVDALEYGFNLIEPGLFHEPSPHQVIVVLTGGSVAHRFAVRTGDLFRDELRHLRPEIERIVVVNLALPGYKQPQQLMTLAWVLSLGAHLDAVVNIDGFNDIALAPLENVPKRVFPFYPRGWSLRVANFDPEFQLQAGEIRVLRDIRARLAAGFGGAPWRYSLTAGLVWTLLDRPLAHAIVDRDAALVADPGDTQPNYRVSGPRRTYENQQQMYEDLATVWKHCSLQMAYLAKGNSAVYLHFLQPNQYVPDSKPFTREELSKAVFEDDPGAKLVRAVYPLLQQYGRELEGQGVHFFDLTRLFEHEKETLYVDACCHFNTRGNEIMAREVARQLAAALP
jgi:hypothetical protein